MSTERPFPRAKLKHPGHATAALACLAGQVEGLQDIGYALSVIAEKAEALLREEDSIVGSGLRGITRVLNDELEELYDDLEHMVASPEWNPGVVVGEP